MQTYRRTLFNACDLHSRCLPADLRVDHVAALADMPAQRLHRAISGGDLRDDEWRTLSKILRLNATELRAFVGGGQARLAEYAIERRTQ